jgi:hypothetical protein
MPMSVRLDEETEALIRQLAKSAGRTKSWVVREAVAEYAAQREAPLRRPFEAFSPFIGVVETGHGTLSENTGDRYAELVTKKQRGRRSR